MNDIRIDVTAGARSYGVCIGDRLIDRLAALLHAARLDARRFIVSSPLVWKLHGPAVARGVQGAEVVLVPDGERFKHLQTVSRIYEALIRARADRASLVIAVGGGVIGDMAGFAAATYLRGVNLVHVPTTLMAQVDSAIGGKVGVNHTLGKNLIGAFHPPALVAIDPSLLATLPRREFRAGLYEVIKYGVIASRDLFSTLERSSRALFGREREVLEPVVAECCRIKADIVSRDERESGPRRLLNLGHTAGHALEAVTKYRRFRHGEAVAYGLMVAAQVAVDRQALTDAERQEIVRVITRLGPLPPIADLSAAQALEAIRRDKKVIDGRLHFVLPTGIGQATIVSDLSEEDLSRALMAVGMRA